MNAFVKVVDATYVGNFKILLEFNDGYKGIIDLKDELWGEVFVPLKDELLFKQFTLKYGVLTWPNGADFAPEYLYERIQAKNEKNIPI